MKEKIDSDLKCFMKEKNSIGMNVLRMLKTDIRNAEVAVSADKSLSDDEIMKIIQTSIKKRIESAEIFEKNDRKELAEKERLEIDILKKYLPEQMTNEDLIKIIKPIVESSVDKNFGKIMKEIMPKVQGKADGKRVSDLIKSLI